MENRDPEYAVCPHCQYHHGDCWEFCPDEQPKTVTCGGCEKEFQAWAEYDVTYVTKQLEKPE